MDWKTIPSLASLRAFDMLAREGSFSAAARELNVTHAAVAQHVRSLETFFNESLAIRDGQGMRLTDTGRELAESLSEGFEQIADGVQRILDRHAARPVNVGLTPSFAEAWLMPRIGAFWAAHPEIQVRLVPSVTPANLRHDGLDIAIRFGRGDWSGVDVEPLAISRFVVVASPDYTKAKTLQDLDKLSAFDWFFSTASTEQRVWGQAIGVNFERVGATELPNNGMVMSAVRAGLGLSIQARTLVEHDLASGQLVALHEGDPDRLGYYMVTRPGLISDGAKTFIAWLKKTAKLQAQT